MVVDSFNSKMFDTVLHLLTFFFVALPVFVVFNLIFLATTIFLFVLEIVLGPEIFYRFLTYIVETFSNRFVTHSNQV